MYIYKVIDDIKIFNEDCINSTNKIPDSSVVLGIFDPPFGIKESKFDQHYHRDDSNIIEGYQEAPSNYAEWTLEWLTEVKRILHQNGSIYVIIGNTNLIHVLNAAHTLGFKEINHLIWKYNFGVNTKKKFVTSHYHVLYYCKSKKSIPVFNTNCRFGFQEKDEGGGSLLYKDLEDVFTINKEYSPGKVKNQNKLPEELINKLIMYSSNENDMVCDFFMGNFTTAYCALKLGRNTCGYELNPNSYDYHMKEIKKIGFGVGLKELKQVDNVVPINQGKPISEEDAELICSIYIEHHKNGLKKKDIVKNLQERFGRGKFSIENILEKYLKNSLTNAK